MKKRLFFSIFLLLLIITSSPLRAMPIAEIEPDGYYLSYNIQAGVEGIQYLNINADLGINENLGLSFGYFYTGPTPDFLDLLIKFKAFSEDEFTISGLLGLHGDTRDGFEGTSAGLSFTRYYSENLDIRGSIQAPWGGYSNIGYSLGLSFHLTPRTSLQVGFRHMVMRRDSFGLLLGLITEL